MSTAGSGMMMISKPQQGTRNQEATIYIGNLDEKATEPILIELMVQAGPVVHAHIPRDRVTQQHQGYGFVEFQTEEDADYAVKIMNGIKLFGKPIRINKSSMDKKSLDVGANLFIGNLAPDTDEKMLFETFILFGTLIQTPKVARDENTGVSRGYGFVSYDSFEASDAAIEAMNGQFLCNRPISVNYAFKKDGKGERHGSAAERLLAAQSRKAALAAGTGPTLAPSQFAMQQMQAHMVSPTMIPAQYSMMGVQNPLLPPNMMYPSNVPSSLYYSAAYPANPVLGVPFSGISPTGVYPQYPQYHQHWQQPHPPS